MPDGLLASRNRLDPPVEHPRKTRRVDAIQSNHTLMPAGNPSPTERNRNSAAFPDHHAHMLSPAAGESLFPGVRISVRPSRRFSGGIAFLEAIKLVDRNVRVLVCLTRRPAHGDRIDSFGFPQSEMEPVIAGGLVASTAKAHTHLLPPAGPDRDDRAHSIAVRSRSLERDRDEVRARILASIVEVHEPLVVRYQERVDSPVIIQITHRQCSPDVNLLERRTARELTSVSRPSLEP